MADISTSQSDNSKFTAWSICAWPSVQTASTASEYGERRRRHPGWTSQTKSLNSSLDFKASQTNQVWQDWNTSRVIAGQQLSDEKAKEQAGKDAAERRDESVEGLMGSWQTGAGAGGKGSGTQARDCCVSPDTLTYERVRVNLDASLSWCWPSPGADPGKPKHGSRKHLAYPHAWKKVQKLTVHDVKSPPEGPGYIFTGEILLSFHCRCKIYTLASGQSELFRKKTFRFSQMGTTGRRKVWFCVFLKIGRFFVSTSPCFQISQTAEWIE